MTVLLALLLLSSPDVPERANPIARCREACERHLASHGRLSVCNRCFTAGDRTAWLEELARQRPFDEAAVRSALKDEDWALRWTALRVLARREAKAEKSYLASWVMRASGSDVLPACLTAARAAASQGFSTADFLGGAGWDGPRAAVRIWEKREEIRRALEVELYATNPDVRRDALAHLSRFLGRSEGKVVLDAMASRPASSDEVIAGLLEDACARSRKTLDAVLLRAARPEDKPQVDRLLKVYAAEIDRLDAALKSANVAERKGALAALQRLMPLSRPELLTAFGDADPGVRVQVGRMLATAEGHGLSEYVRASVAQWAAPHGNVPPDVQVHWVEVLGRSGDWGCAPVLRDIARNAALAGEVRAAAFEALAACAPKEGVKLLGPGLSDASPQVRAAAVRGLAALPRQRAAEEAAAQALGDPEPEVVVSALATVAAQGQVQQGARVAALLTHASPRVREEAARSLQKLPGSGAYAQELARRVREDSSAGVRGAAVVALGEIGGPVAVSALTTAAQDSDGRVQYLAKESLRRLGFQR